MNTLSKVLLIILGVMMISGGFYCLFAPGLTYLMVGFIVGLSMVLDALGLFIIWWHTRKEGQSNGWLLAGAILSAVFGFFVLNSAALQLGIDIFITYYIDAWLLCHGILVAIQSFNIRKLQKEGEPTGRRWYILLLIGILMCVFGVLSILNPLIIASAIGIFIGLGIVITGANLITLAFSPTE